MHIFIVRIFTALCVFLYGGLYSFVIYASESRSVTLVASVTIENHLNRDISGYLHRISMPVETAINQRLTSIRFDYPESLIYRNHIRGETRYVEFKVDVPAQSKLTRQLKFNLDLFSYDYSNLPEGEVPSPKGIYIKPRKYIESNSDPVILLSQKIRSQWAGDEERLLAAFQVPQDILDYQVQKTRGALYAAVNRVGDCTEYAALFVALARSMGYPARVTSEFLFTSRKEFSQPNHHAAEVYLNGRWIPVDPNLATDEKFGYGFGVGSVNKITLTRDFTWVWSNMWPKRFSPEEKPPKVTIHWKIE